MNRIELETKIRNLGLTYMHHQAMTGSEYITINGYKYRIADHEQPSHYQVKNYINCCSYKEVFEIAKKRFEDSKKINTTDEYIYCDELNGFIKNENYINV